MRAPILIALGMLALSAHPQIEVIEVLGPTTPGITVVTGSTPEAYRISSTQVIQPGTSPHARWAVPGEVDPITLQPRIRPGSNDPALIMEDDMGVDAKGTALMYTFVVDGPNQALVLWTQATLQDPPDHTPQQKPSFFTQLRDEKGNQLPCTGFRVVSASSQWGWSTAPNRGDVFLQKWTPRLIPLADFVGQELTLLAAVTDCSQGKHAGWVSLMGYRIRTSIAMEELPCAGGYALTAPAGGEEYIWRNDSGGGPWYGEAIVARMPGNYTVVVRTPAGCDFEMSAVVPAVKELPTVGPVKVGGKLNCAVPGVELTAPDMDNIAGYSWSLAGTSEVLGTGPTFMARKKGTYLLTMPSTLGEGCGVQREAFVDADMSLPKPLFSASATDICQGDSVMFEVVTPASAAPVKVDDTWDFGDGTTGIKPCSRVYEQPGTIIVERAFTRGTCEERHTVTVNVHPLPRPGLRVLTHCGPARGQRTYEFVPTGIAPSPRSLVVTLTARDGQPYPQQRNGSNILVTIPGDTAVRYQIEVTDALGCYGAHDTTWTAPFDPVADFRWLRIPPPGAYHLAITDSSRHFLKQVWQADGAIITSDSLGRAVLFDYDAPGEYLFTLEVTGGDNTCPDRQMGSEVIRMPHFEQLFGNTFQWPAPFERLTPIR